MIQALERLYVYSVELRVASVQAWENHNRRGDETAARRNGQHGKGEKGEGKGGQRSLALFSGWLEKRGQRSLAPFSGTPISHSSSRRYFLRLPFSASDRCGPDVVAALTGTSPKSGSTRPVRRLPAPRARSTSALPDLRRGPDTLHPRRACPERFCAGTLHRE